MFLAASCTNLGYYMQSARGQIELLNAREPIVDVLARPETPPELKSKLEFVLKVREFASRELMLPDNGSYRGYADLKREHVVWNVFAAPEFSLELRRWCFMVAGCVGYRGYFSRDAAERLGDELRAERADVFVAGIDAYSTLGWFDDPVLNTFVRRPESLLAGLIFHELAHQRIYIDDDTTFNESFARAVEVEGVRRWLAQYGTPDDVRKYERTVERQQQFIAMIASARDKLRVIYAGDAPEDDRRRAKRAVFDGLLADYAARKSEWDGYDGYDKWFSGELNNAKLGSVSAYTEKVPAFVALLRASGGDFGKFFAAVEAIGKLPKAEREQRLVAPATGAVAAH